MSSPSIPRPAATISPPSSRRTFSKGFTPTTTSSVRWRWCPSSRRPCPRVSDNGLTYTIRIKPGVSVPPQSLFRERPTGRARVEHPGAYSAADFVLAFKRIADYHINTGLGLGVHRGPHRGTRRLSREQPAVPHRRFFPLRPAGRGSRSGGFAHPALSVLSSPFRNSSTFSPCRPARPFRANSSTTG